MFWNGKCIFFDREYPKKILEKLKEYTKVKRILRQSNTRPFGLLGLESTTKMDSSCLIRLQRQQPL